MNRRNTSAALALMLLAVAPAMAHAAGDPLRDRQWNLEAVNAAAAHGVTTGAGAIVAVIDSGVDGAHPDLAGGVIPGPDFVDGDRVPHDQHGHGTNVAGIIAARTGNGIGIASVAPAARILAIRILDANNSGDTDQEAAGIDAAVSEGAHVINLSLSGGPNVVTQVLPDSRLVQSIDRAVRAGVVVVAAAGNDGVPLCAQPLLVTKILCVGAVNRARSRSTYSNYAVRVDLVAPGGERRVGEAIVSTQLGGGFAAMAGTSQATPHVAGAAALLVSLGLRGRAVIDRLERTATPLDGSAQLGHGLLNMGAAVAGIGPVPQPAAARAELTARVAKRIRHSSVRRRGVGVVCTRPTAGACTVRVTRDGRVLARGSRRVGAGVASRVDAKLTRRGRRALERMARIGVRVRVTARGFRAVSLRTTLVR